MQSEDIEKLVSRVLQAEWPATPLRLIRVHSQEDHLGEQALFIKATLDRPGLPLGATRLMKAQHALREELTRVGDDRFPYFEALDPDEILGEYLQQQRSR